VAFGRVKKGRLPLALRWPQVLLAEQCTNRKARFSPGLSDTLYKENTKLFLFRCGAADRRLSATHGLTTAFLHR